MCGKAPPFRQSNFGLSEATPRVTRRSLLEDLTETSAGKPEAFRTSGGKAAQLSPSNQSEVLEPSAAELAVLSRFERFAFRVTHRMNRGAWKRFWTWCQSVFGAGWIQLGTCNLMRVYGLENIEAVDHDLPILLVANH